jgi:hydrogenase maturation protease
VNYVLGLGNVLMGDDGLGPVVVRTFEQQYEVDAAVEIVDLGTPGIDLSPWFADVERVVLVDTVKADLPPGTLRLYDKSDLLKHAPTARVSPHDPGVKEMLHTLEFVDRGPREVVLVGVVPATTAIGIELSPAVRDAVPAAIAAVVAALLRFGHDVRPRAGAPSGAVPFFGPAGNPAPLA